LGCGRRSRHLRRYEQRSRLIWLLLLLRFNLLIRVFADHDFGSLLSRLSKLQREVMFAVKSSQLILLLIFLASFCGCQTRTTLLKERRSISLRLLGGQRHTSLA
jgi:hypothetical protein